MGTPSSTQTRITSVRSIPSSFDSSSGVRWLAISLLSRYEKTRLRFCADGLVDCSSWVCDRNQGACLPELLITPRIIGLGDGRKGRAAGPGGLRAVAGNPPP